MNPPSVYEVTRPSAQSTTRSIAKVHSMMSLPSDSQTKQILCHCWTETCSSVRGHILLAIS
jgi:hypothetical protein